jgi:hypothetical protein
MSRKLVEENAELEHGSRVTPTIAIKHAVRDRDSLNNPPILGCEWYLSDRLQSQLTGNSPWKPRHLVYNAEWPLVVRGCLLQGLSGRAFRIKRV